MVRVYCRSILPMMFALYIEIKHLHQSEASHMECTQNDERFEFFWAR